MNHPYTPGSLFLTPRAPNGKRLPARARHRHHMRASEDKKAVGAPKEMLGLSGQMDSGIHAQAPNGTLAAQMGNHDPRLPGRGIDAGNGDKYKLPAAPEPFVPKALPVPESGEPVQPSAAEQMQKWHDQLMKGRKPGDFFPGKQSEGEGKPDNKLRFYVEPDIDWKKKRLEGGKAGFKKDW
jgi:hypothetical protein